MRTINLLLKFACTVACFGLFISASYSQDANQQKYWTYRKRFFDHFIVTSSDQNAHGTNIPAHVRHLYGCSLVDPGKILDWADGTIFLSQYINVLTTEYRLLKNNGQDYSETISLLAGALNTYLRLDKYAETFFQCNKDNNWPADLSTLNPPENDINGFFIRDDVPAEIIYYDAHHLESDNYNDDYDIDINNVASTFTVLKKTGETSCREVSMDQIWHLLLSMALVNKLVDDCEESDFIKYGHTSIRWMAKEITRLMITWARHDQMRWWGDLPVLAPWVIVNPVTHGPVGCHDGGEIITNGPGSWAFGEAGTVIYGENLHYWGSDNQKFYFTDGLNWIFPIPSRIMDNYSFFCLSTIIGNVLNADILNNGYDRTYGMLVANVQASGGHFEHLPLIFKLLHNVSNEPPPYWYNELYDIKSHCKSMLDQAPSCGPYSFHQYVNNDCVTELPFAYITENDNWSSPNRLYDAASLVGISPGNYTGFYNGLDYMLLYNLYQLAYPDPFSNITFNINYDLPIMFPVPTSAGTIHVPIGYEQLPANFKFPEITANNTINSNGWVTYTAGKKVTLSEGFHAVPGAHFRACIDQSLYYHPFADEALYSCGTIVSAHHDPQNSQEAEKDLLTDEPLQEGNIEKPTKEIVIVQGFGGVSSYEQPLNGGQDSSLQPSAGSLGSNPEPGKRNPEQGTLDPGPETAGISVYPNPTNGKFTIAVTGYTAPYTLDISNYLGISLYRNNSVPDKAIQVDMTNNTKGIYFVRLAIAGKQVSKRLVLQ